MHGAREACLIGVTVDYQDSHCPGAGFGYGCSSLRPPPYAAAAQAMNAPISIDTAVKRLTAAADLRAVSAAWRISAATRFSWSMTSFTRFSASARDRPVRWV